jgi:hypothetical protein
MLNAISLENTLRLTLGNEGRHELAQAYDAESLIAEWLHEKYEFIRPEEIGALTDAPILVDCDSLDYSDDTGERVILDDATVYWFPDYAVRDPWQELKTRGRVSFRKA